MGRMLSPIEHHHKHHRLYDGTLPRYMKCGRCIEARQKCANKVVYKSRSEADDSALQINIERRWFPGSCMWAYRCRYAEKGSMHWHLTTATRQDTVSRVEKMRRKWMRRTNQKETGSEAA